MRNTVVVASALAAAISLATVATAQAAAQMPENPAAHAVANGEAEIGMTQISEILPYAGAELVGPFPKEIQLTTSFAAAVGTNAGEAEAAKA